jgi:hypothetical protein
MEIQVLFAEYNELTGGVDMFDHVANVNAPEHYDVDRALEYAFRRLQNIEGSWSMGPECVFDGDVIPNFDYDPNVVVLKPLHRGKDGREWGHRSCAMYDRMIVDGKIYKVSAFGFEEIVND